MNMDMMGEGQKYPCYQHRPARGAKSNPSGVTLGDFFTYLKYLFSVVAR